MSPATESIEMVSAPRRRLWWTAWVLLALTAGLMLFVRGLSRRDEGRYAETAREMVAPGGDFWELRLMGIRYYEKPPMLSWLSAAPMKWFGVSGAAARFPLFISMLGTLALCYHWSRRAWGKETAQVGAAVLFSCMGFIAAMSILLTDPLLVMFFTATCLFLYESYRVGATANRWRWLLAAAGAAWGGVLTKGFVAIVLPGAILFIWLLWERRLRDLWRWSLIPIGLGFLAALAAALWHIEQHNPGFNLRFIVQEHLQRFTGTRSIQGHPEPAWFFIPILPALLFPWVFFAPRALRGMRANHDLKTDSFSRYLLVWSAVVFLFFSASTGKLVTYIMPLVPPLALLLARRGLVPERVATDPGDRRWWATGAFLPLLAPVGVAVFWTLARTGVIDQDFGAPRWITLAPILAGLAVWVWICRRGVWKIFSGLLLSAALAYASLAILLSPPAGPDFLGGIEDYRPFYRDVARQVGAQDELVVFVKHTPAVAFYLERIPWMYQVRDELVDGMAMEPDRPGIFQTAAELNAAIRAHPDRTCYAVVFREFRDFLDREGLHFAPEVLAENRELVLLRLLPSP